MPVPVMVADCWGWTLSVTRIVAEKLVADVGAKVRLIVQLAPAARAVPQVLVWPKAVGLAPARTMLVMLSAAFPGLDRVRVWPVAVLPTVVEGKAADAVSTACGAGAAVPVPLRTRV